MRVVVTRPEPGGQRTAERLTSMGHDPVRMPLFEMRLTATPDDLPPAEAIAGLIATSSRAFAMFEGCSRLPENLVEVPVHVVGPATGQTAREAGFITVHESGGSAKALARTLTIGSPSSKSGISVPEGSAHAKGLVYLAGVPRRPVIEAALTRFGPPFSVLECYEMDEISYSTDIIKSDILSPSTDAVLFFSANAARRFRAHVRPQDRDKALESTRFVCLSPAIAAELPLDWQERSVVAARPDEDSLLASLAALG